MQILHGYVTVLLGYVTALLEYLDLLLLLMENEEGTEEGACGTCSYSPWIHPWTGDYHSLQADVQKLADYEIMKAGKIP